MTMTHRPMRMTGIIVVGVLAIVLALLPFLSASAHGCVRSSGFWGRDFHLTQYDNIPYPAVGNTYEERITSALEILNYGGPDMVAKLRRQTLAMALTLHNGVGDAQPAALEAFRAALTWLQTDGVISDRAEFSMVSGWKDVIDAYNNGGDLNLGPPACS